MLAEAQNRCGFNRILHMLTPWTVAVFTGPVLKIITRATEKQLAHTSLSEFVQLVWVTGLTLLVTDVSRTRLLLRPGFSHTCQTKDAEDPDDAPYRSTPLHPNPPRSALTLDSSLLRPFSSQPFIASDSLRLRCLVSVPRVHSGDRHQRPFTVALVTLLHRAGTIGISRIDVGMGRYWHA